LLGELAEYVRLLASNGPLVLVLEEMQWADSWSWDALEHLIRQLDGDRIMICMTFLTEASSFGSGPHDSAWIRRAGLRPELSRQITVANLTRDEVKQWLDAAFHRKSSDASYSRSSTGNRGQSALHRASASVAGRGRVHLAQRNPLGVDSVSSSASPPADPR
jgi:hypothetical protein